MSTRLRRLLLIIGTAALGGCPGSKGVTGDTAGVATEAEQPKSGRAPFRVPDEKEIDDSVTLAAVRRGRALIHSTGDSLPGNVRASLSCSNCHLGDGTQKSAMPLVGSYARFPQYRARSARVDLIEDRINDCFVRSMNGEALDPRGRDMHDMVAYLAFLSSGFPVGQEIEGQGLPDLGKLRGDTTEGRQIFASTCVACHGPDGQGTNVAPPLWGPRSFNIGAGMARLDNAARFIHQVMPRDRPGILTPQQAYDVAAYVVARPRPDFPGKENDWPHGGAPSDVAYRVKSMKTAPAR